MFETGTYKIATAPATEPLTASEVKNYLKVDSSDDDALIALLITSARMEAEKYLQMALLPQTIEEYFDNFYHYGLRLSISPLISVTNVKYTPTGGTEQTLSTDLYETHPTAQPPLIIRKENVTFPEVSLQGAKVKVTYQAGFANAASVPAPIKIGMLKTIAAAYQDRQDAIMTLPTAAMHLYNAYRVSFFR